MIFLLVFWLFLLGALAIGWQAGDRRDRKVIGAIGAAATLTAAANMLAAGWQALALVAAIDLALLGIVGFYALTGNRHWPVWFAAFQASAAMIGIAALFLPAELRLSASMIGGFWAIPALVAMVVGLLRDQRAGIANTHTGHAPNG